MDLQSTIAPLEILSFWDGAVFVLVLLLTFYVIWLGHRRPAESESEAEGLLDYLLMGRRLTLPLFTASLVATWYGGVFGVTEIAFRHGVYNFLTQGVFWYATYIAFALLLVDRVAAFRSLTLPELVGKMFGPRSAKVAAVFNFFNVVPIAYAMSIGLLVQLFIGGSLFWGTLIGTALVCLYAIWGGFRAVVFSDLVQFGVMCLAVLLVVIFAAEELGGLGYLRANLPASHFSPLGDRGIGATLVWGLIALSTLVDPNFYQRCFAAQTPATAKKGILIATVIWCGFDCCTTLGGMYARAAIPEADPSQGYLILSLQILPPGLRGLFLAGIAATILSTLDSYLFIAANTIAYDLMPARFRTRLWINRASVGVVGLLAALMSLLFEGSVKEVWKTLGSYSAGCLLLPVMVGYIRPGWISDLTFVAAAISGAVGITAWRLTDHTGFWAEVDGLYIGVACTLAVLIVGKLLGFASTRRRSCF